MRHDSAKVASATREFVLTERHRLPDGRIHLWSTDNGSEFTGSKIDAYAHGMVEHRRLSVPNKKQHNPFAERSLGVIQ